MNSSRVREKFDHPVATALTLVFFACLVLVPTLLRYEPLKWQAAHAMVQYERGDRDTAIKSLQQAASKLTGDQHIQFTLVEWLIENGRADEAVEHCNRHLEHAPESATWLKFRRESECGAGNFQAAWQTHQELKRLKAQTLSRSAEDLNEQAYFRALAGKDLPIAWTEIQQAVAKVSYDSGVPGFDVPLPSQAIIAASLLSRHVEAQSSVLPQLHRRIGDVRKALEDRERLLVDSLEELSKESFPLNESRERLLQDRRSTVDFRRQELAFLMVCRALLFEDLENHDRCDSDRVEVSELGFQPQTVADMLPEDSLCHPIATRAVAYLDTRALVLTKMLSDDLGRRIDDRLTGSDALADLDISIAVCEVIDRQILKLKESTAQELKQFRKVYAAVLHHRVIAHRKFGNAEQAQSDRERIKSLGVNPDAHVY
jgi:tetratricopeptide (TPR) repeat protein